MNTALISGGTSGIGLATAAVLLDRGWQVAVSGRNRERGQAALQELEGKGAVHYIEGDVSRDEDCRKMVIETVRRFGGLDGLVTSAGIYEQGLLENVTPDDVQQLFAAVVAFTKSLALEAAPHQIRVNCVCPGDVETPMLEKQLRDHPDMERETMKEQYPLYRLARADEVAKAIAFLLSEDSSFITAAALPVDGGLTSW